MTGNGIGGARFAWTRRDVALVVAAVGAAWAVVVAVVGAAWVVANALGDVKAEVARTAAHVQRNGVLIERNAKAIERNAEAIGEVKASVANLAGQFAEHVREHTELAGR